MKIPLVMLLVVFACTVGVSAFGATTHLNEENVKVLNNQLQRQGGLVGSCRDVRLELRSATNPIAQPETSLNFHFVARDGNPYNFSVALTTTAVLVGDFDESGNGYASFYQTDASYRLATAYFAYSSGTISDLFFNGASVCK